MNAIQNLIGELKQKLSPASRAALDDLVKLPAAQSIFEQQEQDELAERRRLIDELNAVPDRYKKLQAEAGKQVEAASERLVRAKAEFNSACEAHSMAVCHIFGLGHQENGAAFELKQKLEAGSDPRLARFRDAIERLRNSCVRHCVVVWPTTVQHYVTAQKFTSFASNKQEIEALMSLMQEAINAVEAAKLQAITRKQVDELMINWIGKLSPGLQELGLDLVVLDADGNVKVQRVAPTIDLVETAITVAGGAGKRVLA